MPEDFFDRKNKLLEQASRYKNLKPREANELMKTNPALYREMRDADRAVHGLEPGTSFRGKELRVTHWQETPDTHSEEDLRLRLKYPLSEVKRYYKESVGSKDNLGEMVKTDPGKVAEIRRAGVLYGLLEESRPMGPKPMPPLDRQAGQFVINKDLGAKFGMPEGSLVDAETFGRMTLILSESRSDTSEKK